MSVQRWRLFSDGIDKRDDGELVLFNDHLAAVEEARRGAYADCRARYLEITRGDPLTFLTFEDWLKARAEGRPE